MAVDTLILLIMCFMTIICLLYASISNLYYYNDIKKDWLFRGTLYLFISTLIICVVLIISFIIDYDLYKNFFIQYSIIFCIICAIILLCMYSLHFDFKRSLVIIIFCFSFVFYFSYLSLMAIFLNFIVNQNLHRPIHDLVSNPFFAWSIVIFIWLFFSLLCSLLIFWWFEKYYQKRKSQFNNFIYSLNLHYEGSALDKKSFAIRVLRMNDYLGSFFSIYFVLLTISLSIFDTSDKVIITTTLFGLTLLVSVTTFTNKMYLSKTK